MGLLDGVTVLDLASVGPAARASGWLADYGARVVKVGSLAAALPTPPPYAYSGGRGTHRLRVDLKASNGRETFLRLCEHADVVIESFRPGVVDRLGIGYDDVKGRNPAIVYCSTSGYGQTGPRSTWAGHDINYLAVAGYLANTERGTDERPPLPGVTVADTAGGGMQAVIAILAALVARATTGSGAYLDVAVSDGVLSMMALQVDQHLATGAPIEPGTAPLGTRFACYDIYRASDGWVAVGAIEAKFWANLCRLVGCEQWIEHQYDASRQNEIRDDLADRFATRSRDEWTALLAGADTCVAPVLTVEEAATDPALDVRAGVATARHPAADEARQLAPLLAGAERHPSYLLPDQSTSDCDAVLSDAGFSAEEIAALRESGAVG